MFKKGLYGNDDLHNALLQVLSSGRQVDALVTSVWNQVSFPCMSQIL